MKKHAILKVLCIALACFLTLGFKLQTPPEAGGVKENPNQASPAMLL